MPQDHRITYRRSCSYNTKSNRIRAVRTPGGKMVAHWVKKSSAGPQCGETGKRLQGLKQLRPKEYKRIPKHARTVSRAYGGVLCAQAVRDRILRAFIIEEQKIVKKVMQEKQRASKK
mmetsp:Transcript_149300/g.212244  ORF Transcript_149300/g.212244 Transcript_149300/m.212244 type:complete len:117 (-) Transcript_149300:93-443(-)